MTAVAFRAKADLRRRWGGWLVLAVIVGAFAGGLIAAAGGARRIGSAYDRFSTATDAADIAVFPRCSLPDSEGGCATTFDSSGLAALGPVDELAVGYSWPAPVTTTDGTLLNPAGDACFSGSGELSVLGTNDERFGSTLNGFLLAAGRLPHPDRADEVALAVATAQRAGVAVGDELRVYIHAVDCQHDFAWGSPTRVRVVGIGQMAGEVLGSRGFRVEGVHASRALSAELLRDTTLQPPVPLAFARLVQGASTEDFVAAAETAGIPVSVLMEAESLREGVQQRLTPDSTVLWLVAVIGGAAAVIVLGSAVARVGATGTGDAPTLRSLGWRRRDFAAWGVVEGAFIGLVAAALAITLAVAASDVVTIGDARHIDPQRGLRLDWWPIVVGGGITTVVVTGAFAIGRLGAVRSLLRPRRGGSRGRWSDVLLGRLPGVPVTAGVGIRFATAPTRSGAVPFWRDGTGLTFGLFGLVAALTFLAGVDHLVTTPRLAGVNWDAFIWLPEEATTIYVDDTVGRLRQDDRVRAASAGTYYPTIPLTVGETPVQVIPMSFSTGPNAVGPTVIDGRAPEGPDEILLNPLLAERLQLSLGQQVNVRVATSEGAVDAYTFELVGTGVLPVGDGRPEIGSAITLDGMRRLAPGAAAQMILVDLEDGESVDSVLSDLGIDPDTNESAFLTGGEQVLGINVHRTRQAPIVLGVVLGLMAAGILAHLSASAVRARTSDIAVIRALGFDSGQVRRAMGWMVTILSGASLVVALPLGVIAGRVAYNVYAESLGVPPEPAVPLWALAGLLPALLVVANLVSLWPSWRASRVATAIVLRTE